MGKLSSLKIHWGSRLSQLTWIFSQACWKSISENCWYLYGNSTVRENIKEKINRIYKKSFACHRKVLHNTSNHDKVQGMGFKMINWPSPRMSSCRPHASAFPDAPAETTQNFSSHVVCVLVNLIQSTRNCFKVENDLIFLWERFQSKL